MSVTPIRHVAVLTVVSPDDWRKPLGSVAAQLPLRLHYSDVWPVMVEELRQKALTQWPGTTMICNMHLREHLSYDGMEHWIATADAYGAVEVES